MNQRLIIPTELPALNEVIAESKAHYARYAKTKREYTPLVSLLAQRALQPIDERVRLHFDWYCKTRRRDPDNIASAKKFILDGLVTAGILADDSWKHISGFTDSFHVDKVNPRVEVDLVGHDMV